MTTKELFKIIDDRTYKPAHYLVHLRERYSGDKDWTDYNVLLEWDWDLCGYIWDWDFNEGQEFVEVLGFIDTDDLEVPDYVSPEHNCLNCDLLDRYELKCKPKNMYIADPDEKTCESWKERDGE